MSSLVFNTNSQSIFAQRTIRTNTTDLQKNIELFSTGFRINRAADGISLIQTEEDGLQIIRDNLQKIRELFIQGVNNTNGINEQNALQREVNERIKVIEDIAIENASASRSRIQDLDIALESSALVKNQILQQTASTMLSQANQTPQIALELLDR